METARFEINYEGAAPLPSEMYEILGYNENIEPIEALIDETLKKAGDYCRIEGGYTICENILLDNEHFHLLANNVIFETGSIINHQLKYSEKAAFFVCTAGSDISKWSHEAMAEGDLLRGYIIDMAGSIIVDKAMDIVQKKLECYCKELSLNITNRFSPGYCGWKVSEQHKLFPLLPKDFCGIQLTDSALMYPIKSVSGIIGIGKHVKFNPYTCHLCEMENCMYRKKPYYFK